MVFRSDFRISSIISCRRANVNRRGEKPCGPERADAVVIADDIFCGVVPLEAETRLWREETGRALTALAREADTVTRIFCGLPMRLK